MIARLPLADRHTRCYTARVDRSAFTASYTPLIRNTLREQLQRIEQPTLHAAAMHLIGRGKLFRPLLALAVFQAVSGKRPDQWVRLATPLELIHTFTLIHDDLPCMDDADMRRGLPSVHLRYGEAMAVLAGDALLNLAITELALAREITDDVRAALIRTATEATQTVVEGQVMDIEAEGRMLSLDELKEVHAKKTGALIGACCETGALLSSADDYLITSLRAIGEMIGSAFQIRDDLISMTSSQAQAGKTLSVDQVKQKATYPRIVGLEESERELERLNKRITAAIAELHLAEPELLLDFASSATDREN